MRNAWAAGDLRAVDDQLFVGGWADRYDNRSIRVERRRPEYEMFDCDIFEKLLIERLNVEIFDACHRGVRGIDNQDRGATRHIERVSTAGRPDDVDRTLSLFRRIDIERRIDAFGNHDVVAGAGNQGVFPPPRAPTARATPADDFTGNS